jgi:hypothetical protein
MSVLLWASGRGASVQDRLCRALAMAEALGARGLGSRLALPAEHATFGWLEAAGMRNPVLLPDGEPELPHVLKARGGADAVVVDVDRALSRAEVRALAGSGPVAVVEGRGTGLAEVDLVVALERDAHRSHALSGPAYVPLRRALRLARDLRGRPRPVPVVVVHLDGREGRGVVERVLGGVATARDAGTRLVARIVADPRTPAWSPLAGVARRCELAPPVAALPDASVASLVQADIAVVGSTMAAYEAVACGVATIVVGMPRGVAPLASGGGVVSLPVASGEERVAAAVTSLVTSPGACQALARAGRALVDGLGAERVADRLIGLLGTTRTIDVGERRVG